MSAIFVFLRTCGNRSKIWPVPPHLQSTEKVYNMHWSIVLIGAYAMRINRSRLSVALMSAGVTSIVIGATGLDPYVVVVGAILSGAGVIFGSGRGSSVNTDKARVKRELQRQGLSSTDADVERFYRAVAAYALLEGCTQSQEEFIREYILREQG